MNVNDQTQYQPISDTSTSAQLGASNSSIPFSYRDFSKIQPNAIPKTTNTTDIPLMQSQTEPYTSVGTIFDAASETLTNVSQLIGTINNTTSINNQQTQFNQNLAETSRRFDQTFFENVRQYNLSYALNEYATRKGIELQQATLDWNKFIQGSQNSIDLKTKTLDYNKQKFDFDNEQKQQNKKNIFNQVALKTLANMMRGK